MKFYTAPALPQVATGPTPSSGFNTIYAKSDDKLYIKNSSGTESLVGPSGVSAYVYFKGSAGFNASPTYASVTDMSWAVRTDPQNGWSTGTNRYTIPISGIYRVTIVWKQNSATSVASMQIQKNGSTYSWSSSGPAASYNGGTFTDTLDLVAGDTISTRPFGGFTVQPDGAGVENTYVVIESLGGSVSSGYGFIAGIGYRSTSATQAIANATFTTVNLAGSTDFSFGSGFSIASNIVTIANAGVYHFAGQVVWDNTLTTNLRTLFRVETWTGSDPGVGLATGFVADERGTQNGVSKSLIVNGYKTLTAGAKIRAWVYQTSGGSYNLRSDLIPAQLNITRVN